MSITCWVTSVSLPKCARSAKADGVNVGRASARRTIAGLKPGPHRASPLPAAPSGTTSARPHRIRRSWRRRAFDFRGRQADDDVVARFQLAIDDLGEVTVGDAGPNGNRRELLVGVENPHRLRTRRPRTISETAEASGAGEARPALTHLG